MLIVAIRIMYRPFTYQQRKKEAGASNSYCWNCRYLESFKMMVETGASEKPDPAFVFMMEKEEDISFDSGGWKRCLSCL